MTGRIVYTEQTPLSAGVDHALSWAGELAAGTYSLRLSQAKGGPTRRVLVQ